MTQLDSRPKIGLAIGSGSARGMAHLGVIERLGEIGVKADIICGSSIGALAGAIHLLGKTDTFTDWISELSTGDMLRYMDISFGASGGFAHGGKLFDYLRDTMGQINIEELSCPYAAVATDLKTGKEIWLREGSIWDAIRASIALPGIMTPVPYGRHWLVDGGLVNPVPVSVCRAMGADFTIAINLNGDLLGRHFDPVEVPLARPAAEDLELGKKIDSSLFDRLSSNIKGKAQPLLQQWLARGETHPGVFDVMASSINIMQDRITRSRLAGEPADIMLSPRLSHIGLLEFDRAAEAIEEGRKCVDRHLPILQDIMGLTKPVTPGS
jgi:NTE family protein